MKWSRSAWASAEPSVGSVPAPSSSSSTSVPGPAASTMRMIERMCPENVDSDWAIDCSSPMSAKTSRKTGRGGPPPPRGWRPPPGVTAGRARGRPTPPLSPAGAHGHDVAAVAQRDDRLLEGAAELGGDERVEAALEPVEGDPDGGPQAAQARRRGIQQLPGRIERTGQRR